MAYQGKFSPENRKNRFDEVDIPAEVVTRRVPTAPKAPSAAAKPAAPVQAPASAQPKAAAPVQSQPAAAPQSRTAASAPRKNSKRKKKSGVGSTVFYTAYFFLIALFCVGLYFGNSWLSDWLVSYEANQPTTKSEEVFQEYFADPDWEQLYEMAGVEDTLYEGSEAFAAYMDRTLQGQITYAETSAGLSGGHKYLLKAGDKTFGHFTMVDTAPNGSELADWQLGDVQLSYSYSESVSVQKLPGQTVYVNGVALTDDHTVQKGTTQAGKYLPNGLKAPQFHTQFLSGLMHEPTVTAKDAEGNDLTVSYDAASDLYIVLGESNTISAEDEARVFTTAKTYALKMIEKASKAELAKYFDSKSQSYKTIVSIDPWMQNNFFRSYEFANESIHGYYRYSDDLFSVHVKLSMFVTRTDDSVKEYNVDHSFFFQKQNGVWKCINMVNVDVSQQVAQVRLTFMYGDQVVSTNFYDSAATSLLVPMPSAMEGMVFAGWYRVEIGLDGQKTHSLVFVPDADGNVTLPAGNVLQSMVLYPLFENAPTEGGTQ